MENSSSMQRGMAPPQGLEEAGLRSKRKVSMPPAARVSAAEDPAGPPPMTAARSLRPERGGLDIEEMMREEGLEVEKGVVLMERESKRVLERELRLEGGDYRGRRRSRGRRRRIAQWSPTLALVIVVFEICRCSWANQYQ